MEDEREFDKDTVFVEADSDDEDEVRENCFFLIYLNQDLPNLQRLHSTPFVFPSLFIIYHNTYTFLGQNLNS